MGAGHDGAARELAARLRAAGHLVVVRDFLDSGPLRIGTALRSGYEFELKHVPSAYEATYRMWYRVPWLCPIVAWLVTALTRRRVLRWVRETGAGTVVSTYPLATLCLGRLRAKGRLPVPAVNFITDFGVHPLWVHRGIDLNLAVHDGPARMAAERTGRAALACGPVVSPAFEPANLPDRDLARAALDLSPDDRAVLVVAGSWGIGGLESTWKAITDDGRFTPVVVCGRDERLRARVTSLVASTGRRSAVLGWTDDMPGLMAACDALVENAGGLTAFEAMRAGVPVVSFDPIAGHGRENTAGMASAGVSSLAATPAQLVDCLAELTADTAQQVVQVEQARSMFRSEAATLVTEVARTAPVVPLPARRPVAALGRVAAVTVGVVALGWTGLTSGVEVATAAAGAGVVHAPAGVRSVAYIGVRLDSAELANPTIEQQLAQMNVTAVVDDTTAAANPEAVKTLVAMGVNVESGGRGQWANHQGKEIDPTLWTRAQDDADAARALSVLTGSRVTLVVPGRRLNAWDLIDCRDRHSSLVVPDAILGVAHAHSADTPIHVTSRHIYLVNGLGATPTQLRAILARLAAGLDQAGLSAVPFATLL
jgi:UDP-N-acetylglucosamine:LPS N-acetylglucosamine transferase